jgi:hypothetical protein
LGINCTARRLHAGLALNVRDLSKARVAFSKYATRKAAHQATNSGRIFEQTDAAVVTNSTMFRDCIEASHHEGVIGYSVAVVVQTIAGFRQ